MKLEGRAISIAIAAVAMLPAPAHSATGDMTVATFIGKYEALKKKGLAALGSPDVGVLKAEGHAAGEAYVARLKADRAAGRTPHSCAPAKARLNQSEFISGVQKYPVASRGQVTLKMAVADLMRKKYPCPS